MKHCLNCPHKPGERVYAGDPGTHTICVCAEHENVKLKLSALTNKVKYRDLIAGAVCDMDSIECMLHRCKKCPGINGIKQVLEADDMKWQKDTITFKNWESEGSRASLQTVTQNLEEFLDSLCSDVWNLTKHHFIAESQKNFLNHCKITLIFDTCIILMDFSENYSFIIQRSIQAFYYNNLQATVHPFVVYYKNENSEKFQQMSFCIISDSKDHMAFSVHAYQEQIIAIIRSELPWIKGIIYFSDSAPTQYKNK